MPTITDGPAHLSQLVHGEGCVKRSSGLSDRKHAREDKTVEERSSRSALKVRVR